MNLRRLFFYLLFTIGMASMSRCQLSVDVPAGRLQDLARDILSVGHPTVRFEEARLVGGSVGGCLGGGGDPRVDVEIRYRRMLGLKDHTMTTRLVVHQTDPCEIEIEVLEDSGPIAPVLLSQALLGPAVSQQVCDTLR